MDGGAVEKGIRPKSGRTEQSGMIGAEESQNNGIVKGVENVVVSEKEDVTEMKRHHKRDKEKKKKSKRTEDADAETEKKGAKECHSTGAYSEEGSEDMMAEVERKRKKREKNKNKNDRFDMGNTKEVDENEGKKLSEGETTSGMEIGEQANKERKNQKAIRSDEVGDNKGEKAGKDVETDMEAVKRKKRKREKKKGKDNGEAKLVYEPDYDSTRNETVDNENASEKMSGKGHKDDDETKKKKKKRARTENDDSDLSLLQQESVPENVVGDILLTKHDENASKKLKKKNHKKENNCKDDTSVAHQDISMQDSPVNEMRNDEIKSSVKGKKKKTKAVENGSDGIQDNEQKHSKKGEKEKSELVEDDSNGPSPNKSNKKVRFSGQVEVFPLPGDSNTENWNVGEDNLIRGKRFTREEDEIVKEAVLKYIEEHDLGDEGLDMVLNVRKHPELKGCWKEIGSAIPYRPYTATYYRAQILFRRSENRKWTQEEYEEVRKYQQEHGNQWKELAEELGKHRFHVKDTWRRIKLANLKKGHWSQDEYQQLFNLVNTDLQMKVSEQKRSKHGMLRDNICWTAISDQLSTRAQATCCIKWYQQLTSPMVAQGVWADTDDYRLIGELYSLDATCMEDVDWDDLLDNRSGDVCRKRWSQMVLHIGQHGSKSFAEQVEVLAQRYCPHLLEARETWDSKPRVR